MIRIQKNKFNYAKEVDCFSNKNKFSGAVCSFLGKVRNESMSKTIKSIFIEHYKEMAVHQIKNIIKIAERNWKIDDYLIIHRYGKINIGENIVLILVASQHRNDSLRSVEYIIDWLKVKAPFWKKETSEDSTFWVPQKNVDIKKIAKYKLKY
tara:strand:+ start:156 stop:611 length:456 start_codon:yes stop_codon:yes gene_type:complete